MPLRDLSGPEEQQCGTELPAQTLPLKPKLPPVMDFFKWPMWVLVDRQKYHLQITLTS